MRLLFLHWVPAPGGHDDALIQGGVATVAGKLVFEKCPRVWLGDLHRLGAVWSIWFILLISLTSIWYLVSGAYRGEALSAHQRLSELADPLHFGAWGGLA